MGLGASYGIRQTARAAVPGEPDVIACDLGADVATRALVRGVEAIVHRIEPSAVAALPEQIASVTSGAYNLLRAAADEGVRRVVLLSSLEMITGYPDDFSVDEDWRPAPSHSAGLVEHLGEFVCREFAREGSMSVVVLRLGTVVQAEAVAGKPFDPLWVEERDAVQAVALALKSLISGEQPRFGSWSVFHILSGSPQARFSVNKAKKWLGYQPQFQG
jgi:uronate dehydrogenase